MIKLLPKLHHPLGLASSRSSATSSAAGCCFQASHWITRRMDVATLCESSKSRCFGSNGQACIEFQRPCFWKSGTIGRDLVCERRKQLDLCGFRMFHGILRASAIFERQMHMIGEGDEEGGRKNMRVDRESESVISDRTEKPSESQGIAKAASSQCSSVTTVGKSTNIVWQECMVRKEEKQKLLGQKGCVIWITGLSGSGKSTLACTLDHVLLKRGNLSYILDGDNLRHGLNNNLGFCESDRAENIRRVGEVAKLFADAGVICIVSVISPYRKDRDACRKLFRESEFVEVYMKFPLSLCEERDPKGLYKLARAGKIECFTGINDPYEAPLNCEVVIESVNGRCPTPEEMAARMVSYLEGKGILRQQQSNSV